MKNKYEKPIAELVVFELTDAIATCQSKVQTGEKSCEDVVDPEINFAYGSCDIPLDEDYCYYSPGDNTANS